jgi:pimeloyl-ACP methyl ester carboxylesterase
MRRSALAVALLVVAACGGSDDDATSQDTGGSSAETAGDPAETAGDQAETTDNPAAAGDPDTEPAVVPGQVATGVLTLDGKTVDYVTVTPAGFEQGDTAPVMLAFPPGGQDPQLTQSVVEQVYRDEALARGWVVVSPAAPRGEPSWFGGSEALAPALLDWIEGWVTPEGAGVHIVGVSNGGISTFRVAGENPDKVRSVLVFPGFPNSDEDSEALAGLTGIPVRMFVGSEDTTWIPPMEEAEATLTALGGDVVLEIVPGEGHIIGALSDGVRIFDELDAAR